MAIEVSPCGSVGELREALAAISHYFANEPTEENAEHFARNIELERMHAARENGRIVGGAGAFTFELTVPGGATVGCAGVTVVGVQPTHRRRGALRALMQDQLEDVRRRGEPLALLWASEPTIYGRFGYGMASLAGEIELPRERTAYARPFAPRGTARIVPFEEALDLVPPVYERVRRETPGMFARTRSWWEFRRLFDNPEWRRGGPLTRVVLELDGEPQAYALYRVTSEFTGGVNSGHVNVVEAVGASPEATAEIWRWLLDFDWLASFRASLLPPDHPLFFLLAEPRRMGYRMGDALWCRVVDAEAALSARSYGAGEPPVLELVDEVCPWNAGRWRLGERVESEPDLRLDAAALGSVYLGGFGFSQLARAGRVEELRAGAAAAADRVFAADRHPWCPEIF